MLEAYIYDGLRTPFGRHSGALARVRPDDLLACVVKEVVARSGFSVEAIDDVSSAALSQAGEDSRNVARHALLLAGLPVETPGAVHNRLCGSGLNAIVGAAHAITCGEADVCVAGGVESMTRAPFVVGKAEQAFAKDFTRLRFLPRRPLPQPKDREPSTAPTPCPRRPTTWPANTGSRARSATCSRSARSRSTPRPPRTASSRARSALSASRRARGGPISW